MARAKIFESIELQGLYFHTQKNKPIARNLTSMFKFHNKVYLFGGLSHTKLEDLWICDLRYYYQWNRLETSINETFFPLARFGHTLVKYQNELFIYGGVTNYTEHPDRDKIVIYNLNTNKFSYEISPNHKEKKQCPRNHTANLIGNSMIIIGGYDNNTGEIIDELWILDLSTLIWDKPYIKGEAFKNGIANHSSTLIVLSERLHHPNFTIYSFPDVPHSKKIKYEGIYFFGGIDGDKKLNNDLTVLSIGKKPLKWNKIPHHGGIAPSERCCSTIDYYENLNVIFIFGGMNENRFFKDLFLFDLENYFWYKVKIFDEAPLERAEHVSFISDHGLIIFGGRNETKFLGSEFYVINLDILEKDRKKKGHSSVNFDKKIIEIEQIKKSKIEKIKRLSSLKER